MTASGHRKSAAAAQQGIKHLFEQALLILLLSFVVWAFLDKARDVRSAAELSAVQVNLGVLRTAIVVDRMSRVANFDQRSKPVVANPFQLLERPPTNYVGEIDLAIARIGALAPGDWFYDRHQALVGYRVQDTREFRGGGDGDMMLFDRAEPELLVPRARYVWRDQVIK